MCLHMVYLSFFLARGRVRAWVVSPDKDGDDEAASKITPLYSE